MIGPDLRPPTAAAVQEKIGEGCTEELFRGGVGSVSWTSAWLVLSVRFMNETRIVDLRTQMGWTQERLADESGVTGRTVQRLEAGDDGSLDTLSRVANAFGVPVRDLFVTVAEDDYGVYWVAGWLLSMFLFLVVLSPRLDRAYPLARAATDEATSR